MNNWKWPIGLVLFAAAATFGGDPSPRVGAYAMEAIEYGMRSWSEEAAGEISDKRPKPFVREKGVHPLPRGIWVRSKSQLVQKTKPSAEGGGKIGKPSEAYRIFQDELHSLEISRSDDGAIGDYQNVLHEAARAARSNQHINYVPIIVSSIEYGILDDKNQPNGKNSIYFRAEPHGGRQFSQLITFGLERGFVLSNLGENLESLELSLEGESYVLTIGSAIPVVFDGPGTFPVSVRVRFQGGAVLTSVFAIVIKQLHDGTYSNSRLDSNGTINFKQNGRRE